MTTNRGLRHPFLLTLLVVGSCRMGGWSANQLAVPQGGFVEVELADRDLEGELLLADEAGILLLSDDFVVFRASWSALEELDFRDRPVDDVADGAVPVGDWLRQIQLASRYPFGLPDDQLATLLESLDQDEVLELR